MRAASDTLPTAVNLRRWSAQCDAKCILCDSIRPTTAHVLNGCPIALAQQRYTYHHGRVLSILTAMLAKVFTNYPFVRVFADLPNHRACEAPQATIPASILITPYHPDIFVYKSQVHRVAMLELTYPLDSVHHLESACNRKQSKVEYLQLLAEFNRLNIKSHYETVEISALGHYQPASIGNIQNFIQISNSNTSISKLVIRQCLDDAANHNILASKRIFLARNCKEWLDPVNVTCYVYNNFIFVFTPTLALSRTMLVVACVRGLTCINCI